MPRDVELELAQDPRVQALCQALMIAGQDEQLMLCFLRDALTFEEIQQFANRHAAATLLLEGRNQTQTTEALKISSKTVNNVARFVTGPYATGGFRRVFELSQRLLTKEAGTIADGHEGVASQEQSDSQE